MAPIDALDPASPHFDAAVTISAETSPASPDDREEVRAAFERDAANPAYRALVMVEDGEVVGVAYGYRSEPGQFLHTRLRESMGHRAADRWLSDCFEVAELGVRADARGRRVGTRLHDALLSEVDAETAVIVVARNDDTARSFARHHGWREVGDLTLGGDDLVVLGRDL